MQTILLLFGFCLTSFSVCLPLELTKRDISLLISGYEMPAKRDLYNVTSITVMSEEAHSEAERIKGILRESAIKNKAKWQGKYPTQSEPCDPITWRNLYLHSLYGDKVFCEVE